MENTETLQSSWQVPVIFVLTLLSLWFFVPATQGALITLGLLSFLIIVHELGHFTVARRAGVKIDKFGIGLPIGPTIYERQMGDFVFCVHAFLMGGYVAFADDNPDNGLPEDSPELLENKPVLWRIAVYAAGIVVNAITSYLLLFLVFGVWGEPHSGTRIQQIVAKHGPAATAGLLPQDLILSVTPPSGTKLSYSSTMEPDYFQKALGKNSGKPVKLEILRDKQTITKTIIPDAQGKIGVQISMDQIFKKLSSPVEVITGAHNYICRVIAMQGMSLQMIATGKVTLKQVSGPIGIVRMGGQVISEHGIQYGLLLAASISIILAVVNFLPIPALDGGWLLFAVIEILRGGKKLNKDFQNTLIQVFFSGLLLLMLFILGNDVWNWISDIFFPHK